MTKYFKHIPTGQCVSVKEEGYPYSVRYFSEHENYVEIDKLTYRGWQLDNMDSSEG